ncbi:MAG: S41 family peptidase [Lentisphaerales bacterium]|jgi:carboxyl-terminal processing protease|nr:MAG: S41 family peptidase [Lentisphaerales bacterium]
MIRARAIMGDFGLVSGIAVCLVAMLQAGCRHPAAALPPPGLEPDERTDAYTQMEKLAEVMLHIKKGYIEEKSYEAILGGALKGMLHSLDEHSYYMEPPEYKDMQEDTGGHYGGIGVLISMKDGHLMVVAPIEDTPGFRARLMSKDHIAKIDDESTTGMTLQDAVAKLRGKPGTTVVLTIMRSGEPEPKTVELVREEITVPSVKGTRVVRNDIGYLRITTFADPTADLLQKELDELLKQGIKGLVIDLRNNPGGLLSSAVQVSEKFLKPGQLIVTTKGREAAGPEKPLRAGGKPPCVALPLAILVNGGSASASEIFAGALQDHNRAVLVGEKTFGKGSVQTVLRLRCDDGSAIRLTTALYYTPSGRQIHNEGIEPDISIPVKPVDWARIVVHRMHMESPEHFTDEEKAPYADAVDVQLERAVDLLRAIQIFNSHATNR